MTVRAVNVIVGRVWTSSMITGVTVLKGGQADTVTDVSVII